jgi:hypothetical protein
MTKTKPSERIDELAKRFHNNSIDPGFTRGMPTEIDYLNAIVAYLDKREEEKK